MQIGTQITGDDVTLIAGQDVNARAAYVNANGALAVNATRDINVNAGEASAAIQDEQSKQSGGFLSKKFTHTIDAASRTEALGSTFSGDTVDMAAGRDLTTAGSTIAATHDVNLDARRNITIGTAETTSSSYSFKEDKKSGSGLSYGRREQKDTVNDNGTQQAGSLVGSTDGSVHMNAGSTLRVTGSDLIAAKDITGVGADVTIEAAQNRQHHDESHEVKQRGFTLGVSGGAIGAAINAANKGISASKSQDGRASALWSIAAARDVADTGAELAQAGGNPLAGAAVTLSWGTSQSKQTLTEDSTSHNGSNVSARGTTTFIATGVDANGNKTAGNLNIIGSNIDANKVALGAKNDINIVSATDTNESHSTNKSSSANVGVSYGAQGFGVSASASRSKGNADSEGTTQANSHVTGKESVTFVSGNDTNILGATVSGGKVVGDVGGNLNIASRQDTEEMRARKESMGGGFSISQGGGSASFSASKGKASGSYANVSEQSGIQAGEGGFDIRVEGNTDLKGAVIASAAGKDKNHLDSGTISFSDIRNHSDYSATSFGVSGGITAGSQDGKSNSGQTSGKNTGGISPMIPQHESGSQDGVAHSAIADGTITIRDEAHQKQDLADLKRDTTGANTSVGKNPNLKTVLDKQSDMMAAAQAAGEAVAKTVGDVAGAKQKEALAKAKAAERAGDAALAEQYRADAENWGANGDYRVALHAAGGALVAGLGGGSAIAGAAGAGAASLASGISKDISNGVKNSLGTGNASLDEAIGNIVANIVAGGIGAVVGGGSGAATAANVDRFNRQLHPDERQLAKKMAANSKGKYTADQIEAQMRLSDRVDMSGNVLESGGPDQINAATTKPYDSGVQWISVAQTTQIREVQAQGDAEIITYIQSQQKAMQGDVPYTSRQDYSNVTKYSGSPGSFPTAKCGTGQGDCAAGLPKAMGEKELNDRRENFADGASWAGQQGRIASTATAAAAIPGAHVPLANGVSVMATAANYALTVLQQTVRPNAGSLAADTVSAGVGEAANAIPGYGKLLAPVVNEALEAGKGSDWSKDAQKKINESLRK